MIQREREIISNITNISNISTHGGENFVCHDYNLGLFLKQTRKSQFNKSFNRTIEC